MKRRHTALLFAFLGLVLMSQLSQDTNFGSTFSTNWGGTRAFMLLLEKMSIGVKIWLEPFEKLDPSAKDQTMFIITPSKFGKTDKFDAWVAAGNRAVIVGQIPSETGKSATPSTERELTSWATEESIEVECAAEFAALCGGIKTVLKPEYYFSRVTDKQKPMLVAKNNPSQILAIYEKKDAGEIVWVADDTPLQNFRIGRFQNLQFFYQLIRSTSLVLFDEFHHGYVIPAEGSIKRRQESAMALVGFIVVFLIIGAFSRAVRFGPPSAQAQMQYKSAATTEFATVLGLLYEEHRARDVLRYYVTAWKRRITALLGISRNAELPYIADELVRRELLSPAAKQSLTESLAALGESGVNDPEEYTRVVEAATQQIIKQLA